MSEGTAPPASGRKRTRRTASKEMRRAQLIDATIESIARHGISGTTLNTVTGYAGLSMGLVNFHFESKEKLFGETLRTLAEEHRDKWRESVRSAALGPASKLLAIVEAHFHPEVCKPRKLAVWFGFYGETSFREAYRDMMTALDNERWEVTTALCHEIVDDGGYDGVDPEEVAQTLEALYDGFWLNILIYPDDFSRDDARTRIRAYLCETFPGHFTSQDASPS